MEDMRPFELSHAGVTLIGRLALPAGPGPHPGIMVMHDGRGVSEFVCNCARALAALGYVALAADMFGGGRLTENMEPVMALRNNGPLLRARVTAIFDAFKALPEVDAQRIGATGYCFGGQCVLELARSGRDAKAVVSFHGTLETHEPARPGEVTALMLALTGARDPFAPMTAVTGFQEEMTAAGAKWQMTLYGEAKHGFSDPIADEMAAVMAGVGYDPLVDRLSWAQAREFLEAVLRG